MHYSAEPLLQRCYFERIHHEQKLSLKSKSIMYIEQFVGILSSSAWNRICTLNL